MAKVANTTLDKIALSVRMLAADAVFKAKSGHPGLPLGLAELGALLFSEVLRYDPADPSWMKRDRLVLSAGHGSMWLYSLLHLSGYDLSLAQIKQFRQLRSRTPGHPEYGHTPGVETTTGPLGAGFSNAVGMAIAERMLSDKFPSLIGNYTYAVSGDGCMMEGVTSEAASLAGHLGLGKLIVFYDSNHITIEGDTSLAFTEDVAKRYEAYNWQVLRADAYDYEGLRAAIAAAQNEKNKPSIIICKSIIGKGAPTMQGTEAVHGAALPAKEMAAMKKKFGVGDQLFYIHPEATAFFAKKKKELAQEHATWTADLKSWKSAKKENARAWDSYFKQSVADIKWPTYKAGESVATRKANGACIEAISKTVEWFAGGSADLEPSNNTKMTARKSFAAGVPSGRMMHFGVREHAMGGAVNGMTLYGGLRAFGATFLVFSDYMRPPIRLASLMKIPSLFVFTHDSIFVGEDGPTHQPVEHAPSLRLIPNLRVFRPADAEESVVAWKVALFQKSNPSAMLFTRQNLPVLKKPARWTLDARKGAYVVHGKASSDVVLVATGSEVAPALEAAGLLEKKGVSVRVVSMLCKELFDAHEAKWRNRIIPAGSRVIIVEAAAPFGWDSLRPIGQVGIDGFGKCGPAEKLKEYYGLTGVKIAARIRAILAKNSK